MSYLGPNIRDLNLPRLTQYGTLQCAGFVLNLRESSPSGWGSEASRTFADLGGRGEILTDRRRTPIFILDFRGSPLVARGRASEGLAGGVRAGRGGRAGVRGGPGPRGTLESGVLENITH